MMQIKQSSIARALVFFMASTIDHVTGKTGVVPTCMISKNGGSFTAPAGTISEVGSGFYKLSPTSADTNTLGILALSATATGADQAAMAYEIVAYDPDDANSLGLARMDENVSAAKTLTSETRDAVAVVVESHLLNDGDSQMLINAIVGAIGNQNVDQAALVAAMRADLERVGGNLASLLSRATEQRLAKLDVTGTLAHSDAADVYMATGFATPINVLDARDAVISAMPTPDAIASNLLGAEVPLSYTDGTIAAALGRLNLTPAEAPVIIVPDPSTDVSVCVVYLYAETLNNIDKAGLTVDFSLSATAMAGDKLLDPTKVTLTTDANGYGSITLHRTDAMSPAGAMYLVTCQALRLRNKPLALTAATFNLVEILG